MRGWMRAKGWEVTATDYHFDQGIYSWRHQQPGGKPPTLRVARQVLAHNPLEGRPSAAIRQTPISHRANDRPGSV
jgi:hypothetical protein